MKTLLKSQYLYLKSKERYEQIKNQTIKISDEEYERLIQYSDKEIIPIEEQENQDPENQEIHTITFKDGDQIIRTITGPMGTYVSVPYVEKEGYEFLGWSLDGEKVTMPVDGIYDSDITYIAVWEEIDEEVQEVPEVPEVRGSIK